MAVISIPTEGLTLTLNGVVCNDFADGDVVALSFPNEKTSQTYGLNGGTNIKDRLNGRVCEMTMRVLRYSDYDIFLNSESNKVTPTVFNGSLQRNFTKDGVDGVERYECTNGSLIKIPDSVISTQDGEEMQEWGIRFASTFRAI